MVMRGPARAHCRLGVARGLGDAGGRRVKINFDAMER